MTKDRKNAVKYSCHLPSNMGKITQETHQLVSKHFQNIYLYCIYLICKGKQLVTYVKKSLFHIIVWDHFVPYKKCLLLKIAFKIVVDNCP